MVGEIIRPEFEPDPEQGGPHTGKHEAEGETPQSEEIKYESVESGFMDIDLVRIVTDNFVGFAIPIYEMPQQAVLDMMMAEGGLQMLRTAALLKLALVDPADVERVEGLSYHQFAEVLNYWAVQSTVMEPETSSGRTRKNKDVGRESGGGSGGSGGSGRRALREEGPPDVGE